PCFYDTNSDGNVDIVDFGVFGAAFNSSTGDMNYDPALDANSDGTIDIVDFGVFGAEFNRTDCLG
ncbi:MAG: dockerin type I domain-containing protein, partial [Ilumatobacteraceae bacterium]